MINLNKKELTDLLKSDVSAFNKHVSKYPRQKKYFLEGVDLSGTDLEKADLRGSYLSGAEFDGANLRDANLVDAKLRRASFNMADIRDVYIQLTEPNIKAIKVAIF